jgi:prepilin-type N-terminal cleavage/methylation domain-containing protein
MPPACPAGFTLIELLVVISIISMLIAIAMPSLSRARANAKVAACASNLGQLGLAVTTYANEHEGLIPRGPASAGPFDFACAQVATNQLWIGSGDPAHPSRYNGLGLLLGGYCPEPKVYYCPADNNLNLREEKPRIGTGHDAYGSYTYRQLDQLPPMMSQGRLSDIAYNVIDTDEGPQKVRVEALAFDTNSLGKGQYRHTNHKAKRVNVLYRDRSVQSFHNDKDTFSIPRETFENPMNILTRLDQIIINADYSYRNSPDRAPQLSSAPGTEK